MSSLSKWLKEQDDWKKNKSLILKTIHLECKLPSNSPINTILRQYFFELARFPFEISPFSSSSFDPFIDSSNESKHLISSQDFETLIGDIIWMLWVEFEENGEKRAVLASFIKKIVGSGVINADILKSRLDHEALDESGIISKNAYIKQVVLYNNKHIYAQRKFNLLGEETEGYSKLITLLNCHFPSNASLIPDFNAQLFNMIGIHKLDPNRVVDIILDSFEMHLGNNLYLEVLKGFKKKHVSQLIGFKFQFYQNKKLEEEKAPYSLFKLAATLVKHQIISFEEVYIHLEEPDIEKVVAPKTEGDKVEGPKTETNPLEQKFKFIGSLLAVDEMVTANLLLEKLFDSEPASDPIVARELCKKLNNQFESIYELLGLNQFNLIESSTEMKLETKQAAKTGLREAISLLRHLKYHIYRDVILYVRLCRILKEMIQWKDDEDWEKELEGLINDIVFPALSFIGNNPSIANEVWEIIKNYSYISRFRFYGLWRQSYERSADLKNVKKTSSVETKRLMKRIAKENVKRLGRQIGKLSHANSVIVFAEVLNQIQLFDSLILPIVDALRYLNPLSQDVISFLIMESLVSKKSKLKSDGTNIETWYSSLALFCGQFFKRYPTVEFSGIVQLCCNQLMDGNSVDLLILKELISKMGNIEIIEDLSVAQVEAQAGGETLRSETSMANQTARAKKSAAKKLTDVLLSTKLASPLAILIAQSRNSIVFKSTSNHLKLIGDLYDKCSETFHQYCEFLNSQIAAEKYPSIFPNIYRLCKEFYLEPETAFHLLRPALSYYYSDYENPIVKKEEDNLVQPMEVEGEQIINQNSLVETALALVSKEKMSMFSPTLYITFWSLSLYDIYVPKEHYESEMKRVEAQINALKTDNTKSNMEIKLEMKKLTATQVKLSEELVKQTQNNKKVMERLEREKDHWFEGTKSYNSIADCLLQICILPRATLSMGDALFCVRFTELMHRMKTPFFSTLQYFDRLQSEIVPYLRGCTEGEANRLGRYLLETMSIWDKWRDPKLWEKECNNSVGLSMSFINPVPLEHSNFLRAQKKWHSLITNEFSSCLKSKEHMEIRNSLMVLMKMAHVFPVTKKTHSILRNRSQQLKLDERPDIKLMATRYYSILDASKDKVLSDEDFSPIVVEKKEEPVKTETKEVKVESKDSRSRSTKEEGERSSRSERKHDEDRSSKRKKTEENVKEESDSKHRTTSSTSTPPSVVEDSKERDSKKRRTTDEEKPKEKERSSSKERRESKPKEVPKEDSSKKVETSIKTDNSKEENAKRNTDPVRTVSSKSTSSSSSPMVEDPKERENKKRKTSEEDQPKERKEHKEREPSSSRKDEASNRERDSSKQTRDSSSHKESIKKVEISGKEPPKEVSDSSKEVKEVRQPSKQPIQETSSQREKESSRKFETKETKEISTQKELPKKTDPAQKEENSREKKPDSKETKDSMDEKRIAREERFRTSRDTRDAKETRDTKDSKEAKDTRGDTKDSRDAKDNRDTRDSRDMKDSRDPKDSKGTQREKQDHGSSFKTEPPSKEAPKKTSESSSTLKEENRSSHREIGTSSQPQRRDDNRALREERFKASRESSSNTPPINPSASASTPTSTSSSSKKEAPVQKREDTQKSTKNEPQPLQDTQKPKDNNNNKREEKTSLKRDDYQRSDSSNTKNESNRDRNRREEQPQRKEEKKREERDQDRKLPFNQSSDQRNDSRRNDQFHQNRRDFSPSYNNNRKRF